MDTTPSERLRTIAAAIDEDLFMVRATPGLPSGVRGFLDVQQRQAERLREIADELEK
jgi:hypothetical protein